MSTSAPYCDYDSLAWFYHTFWGGPYHELVLPVLEELLLCTIPPRGAILDLCCGTGHLTQILAKKGFSMTGVDGSDAMLHFARERLPNGSFMTADARAFSLPERFHAAVSTFESLNHIMSSRELGMVFRNVYASLVKPGVFVFDLVNGAAYRTKWGKAHSIVGRDNVCIVRGGYNRDTRVARSEITMFRLEGEWSRSDVVLFQKCHAVREVREELRKAGFSGIETYDARKDFGIPGDLGCGRTFFRARAERAQE